MNEQDPPLATSQKDEVPAGTFSAGGPEDPVEIKKDTLDLRPAIKFVSRHAVKYGYGLSELTKGDPQTTAFAFASGVSLINDETVLDNGPQILPSIATLIISKLPPTIIELSMLKTVDYGQSGIVPVPLFDKEGNVTGVDLVKFTDFPRNGDHPSRIYIGRCTGDTIFPTALPSSVFEGKSARLFYQLHVLLHEFFHTVELLRRDPEKRQAILLEVAESSFTLQDWWESWEGIYLSADRPKLPTRYAETYADALTWETKKQDPGECTKALAEVMCESFVGYILGIAPNDADQPIFRQHSPVAWWLINKLATAKILKK
jgi:hypothetical protein